MVRSKFQMRWCVVYDDNRRKMMELEEKMVWRMDKIVEQEEINDDNTIDEYGKRYQ